MSEAETRNVFEFQLGHSNIFASFHYHNTGRLIMFQAPPAVQAPAGPGARRRPNGSSRWPSSGSRS